MLSGSFVNWAVPQAQYSHGSLPDQIQIFILPAWHGEQPCPTSCPLSPQPTVISLRPKKVVSSRHTSVYLKSLHLSLFLSSPVHFPGTSMLILHQGTKRKCRASMLAAAVLYPWRGEWQQTRTSASSTPGGMILGVSHVVFLRGHSATEPQCPLTHPLWLSSLRETGGQSS